ncbi:MAG: helix-turn-helix domain-containing protein [Ruminococcaceae bacterium]|nr:helix-turn-helix domain-containing protein [Oscillospiraceae bacterium]
MEVIRLDYKIVGSNIREARKKVGLTQKELGVAISRTESSIAKYEQGLVEIPDSVLSSIAQILGVDPWKLRGYDGYIRIPLPEYPMSMPTKEQFDRLSPAEQEYVVLRMMADSDPDELKASYIENYDKLNKLGQVEAVRRSKELTLISTYTEPDRRQDETEHPTPTQDTPTPETTPETAE